VRLWDKGNELFKAKEFRSAVDAYTLSLALEANSAPVHANRAAAYMKLRRWEDAEADCTAALVCEPGYFKALMRRGAVRLETGVEGAEAAALTFEAEAKLLEAITERKALYAWRTEREAWEITTKANFLQMETEMKEAKTRLKSAEFGSNEAFELSVSLGETQGKSCISQIPRLFDHTILTLFFKTQAGTRGRGGAGRRKVVSISHLPHSAD